MKKRSFALLLTALMMLCAACSTRAEKPTWLSVGGMTNRTCLSTFPVPQTEL